VRERIRVWKIRVWRSSSSTARRSGGLFFAPGVRDRFSGRQQQQLCGCFVAEMAATVYNLFVINKSGGLIFYKVIKMHQIKKFSFCLSSSLLFFFHLSSSLFVVEVFQMQIR
jgi:hypothetical protein